MLLNHLFEAIARTGKGDTAVVGWGRGMGHKGHMMLASSVITKAKDVGGDPYFVVSRTVGKDDPITPDEKLAIYKKVFPQQGHIFQAASDEIPDLTRVLTNLNQQGYKNAVVVVGADQVKAFQYLKQYNGKADKSGNIAFNFDNLEVISRQETGDPSAGEEGPRATPMRNVLMDPNATPDEQFRVWRDAMNPEVSDDEVADLMNKAKERMAQYAAPKKKAVAPKESKEADYGADYQDKVKRLGQMAKQGPRKTVWDPVKRVYKTVPVNPPKQQGAAEGDNFTGDIKHNISASVDLPKWKIGLPVFVKHLGQKGTIDSLGNDSAIVSVGMRQYRVKLNDLKRYPSKGVAEGKHIPISENYQKKIYSLIEKLSRK